MMSNLFRVVVVMLLLASGTAGAGQERPQQPPKASAQKEAPAKSSNEPARPVDVMLPVNVRVELTITDQRGDTQPVVKTVSMIASDRSWSRIRTGGEIRSPQGVFPVILNVDARPTVLGKDSARARVELTIEYRPSDRGPIVTTPGATPDEKTTPNINESLSVILDDGKSMLISQSADPVTDRKVKLEVKATILK